MQKQLLTQWEIKKGEKRCVDVIDDNSEPKSKKNFTYDNDSTINVNYPLSKKSSTLPIEPTSAVSKNNDRNTDVYS